ncbi:MAG TPA: hypothetical protein VGM54_18245 [Chthoniobacter sp.]|jgi:hypothetical protein
MDPLEYEFDISRRCVHVTYRAQPRFDEWEATMKGIFEDVRLEPAFGILLDRRDVPCAASTNYIRSMVRFIDAKAVRFGSTCWAIVVSDLTSFGVGRMAEQIAHTGTIRTFSQIEEAQTWLRAKKQE